MFFGSLECVGPSFAYVAYFCIFERFLDSNPESCRSKQARCQLVAIVVYRHRIDADLNSDSPFNIDAIRILPQVLHKKILFFVTFVHSSANLHCFNFIVSVIEAK